MAIGIAVYISVSLISYITLPKKLWCSFEVRSLSFYDRLPNVRTDTRNVDLLTITFSNDYEHDVIIKTISVQPIKYFIGASVMHEIADEYGTGKTQYKFNEERLSAEALKIISGNINIPASERVSIYIYANRISRLPQIDIHSDKGMISAEQEFRVNNRFNFMLYKNVRHVYILILICIGFYIFNRYRSGKLKRDDTE